MIPEEEVVHTDPVVTLAQGAVGTGKDVRRLRHAMHRTRTVLTVLAVTLVLDIAVTSGVIFLYQNQSQQAALEKQQVHKQKLEVHAQKVEVYDRCVQGNVFRSRDKRLWTYVLNVSSQGPQTPQSEVVLARFKNLLDKLEAPVVCSLKK